MNAADVIPQLYLCCHYKYKTQITPVDRFKCYESRAKCVLTLYGTGASPNLFKEFICKLL